MTGWIVLGVMYYLIAYGVYVGMVDAKKERDEAGVDTSIMTRKHMLMAASGWPITFGIWIGMGRGL